MINNYYKKCTHKYSIEKMLRFELKPYGETAEKLSEFKDEYLKEIVEKDSIRANEYKKTKAIINDYHREFISDVLKNENIQYYINISTVEDAFKLHKKFQSTTNKNDKEDKKDKKDLLKNLKDKLKDKLKILRKKLIDGFVKSKDESIAFKYKNLFKKELIQIYLPEWLKLKDAVWFEDREYTQEEAEQFLKNFYHWTSYFTGFHENRKNMYSDEDKSTSIANRSINENMITFFNNYIILERLPKNLWDELTREEKNVFKLDEFANCISQKGIDNYNKILGEINEKINLYQQKEGIKIKEKLKKLHNQIMGTHIDEEFLPEGFIDDISMLDAIQQCKIKVMDSNEGSSIIQQIKVFFSEFDRNDSDDDTHIYLKNDTSLTQLSSHVFGHWRDIENIISDYCHEHKEKWEKEKFIPYANLKKAVAWKHSIQDDEQDKEKYNLKKLGDYFCTMKFYSNKSHNTELGNAVNIESKLNESLSELTQMGILNLKKINDDRKLPDKEGGKGGKGFEQLRIIKSFLDDLLYLVNFMKIFALENKKEQVDMPSKDLSFYNEFETLYKTLGEEVIPLYNKVRNYVTKKPYKLDKIKINFEKVTLLDGWDKNKEKSNLGFLMLKDNKYYLGIMHATKGDNMIFSDKLPAIDILATKGEEAFRKVEYKLLPGASKMLPKVFFANAYKNKEGSYLPDEKINKIRNHASHTKGGKPQEGYEKKPFVIEDCHALIDFYKEAIKRHEEWECFDFNFSDTKSYEDTSYFFREVEQQGYKISYKDIKASYINDKVASGGLSVFEIYNKDFSQNKNDTNKKKAKDNLHTMYWKGIFQPENLQKVVIKLNGEAEIFYRPKSLEKKITHPKNNAIASKRKNTHNRFSRFSYDIIKDKRFTQDKFFFHVPITLNFKLGNMISSKFNTQIIKLLQHNKDINIIGIDRGEKNLLYYTVINQKGRIIAQNSLNEIEEVRYHDILNKREEERARARGSWATIKNIKELKAGYLSKVVYKISQLVIEHNAILILENLNFGFKKGRFKVEKQVYQKFEKALIDKLNYLVDKNTQFPKEGHYLNAYQLTAPFESFQKLGLQSGILFYVPAYHTSKVCPITGFVNFLYPKFETIEKANNFFKKFDKICYNSTKKYFEFHANINQFVDTKKKEKGKIEKQDWVICSHGDSRWVYDSKNKSTKKINVSDEIISLCEKYKIDYRQGNLQDAIIKQDNAYFFKRLIYLLKVLLQLRYSNSVKNEDFILSPIADSKGKFFHSNPQDRDKPIDSDANGAYHIALKGLLNLQEINKWDGESNLQLAISNNVWYNFIQKNTFLDTR